MDADLIGELVVLRNGERAGALPVFRGDAVTMGRAADAVVRVRLPEVALLAARMVAEAEPTQFVTLHCECTSGVSVNGGALSCGQARKIMHGDVVSVAKRDFRFEYSPQILASHSVGIAEADMGGPRAVAASLNSAAAQLAASPTAYGVLPVGGVVLPLKLASRGGDSAKQGTPARSAMKRARTASDAVNHEVPLPPSVFAAVPPPFASPVSSSSLTNFQEGVAAAGNAIFSAFNVLASGGAGRQLAPKSASRIAAGMGSAAASSRRVSYGSSAVALIPARGVERYSLSLQNSPIAVDAGADEAKSGAVDTWLNLVSADSIKIVAAVSTVPESLAAQRGTPLRQRANDSLSSSKSIAIENALTANDHALNPRPSLWQMPPDGVDEAREQCQRRLDRGTPARPSIKLSDLAALLPLSARSPNHSGHVVTLANLEPTGIQEGVLAMTDSAVQAHTHVVFDATGAFQGILLSSPTGGTVESALEPLSRRSKKSRTHQGDDDEKIVKEGGDDSEPAVHAASAASASASSSATTLAAQPLSRNAFSASLLQGILARRMRSTTDGGDEKLPDVSDGGPKPVPPPSSAPLELQEARSSSRAKSSGSSASLPAQPPAKGSFFSELTSIILKRRAATDDTAEVCESSSAKTSEVPPQKSRNVASKALPIAEAVPQGPKGAVNLRAELMAAMARRGRAAPVVESEGGAPRAPRIEPSSASTADASTTSLRNHGAPGIDVPKQQSARPILGNDMLALIRARRRSYSSNEDNSLPAVSASVRQSLPLISSTASSAAPQASAAASRVAGVLAARIGAASGVAASSAPSLGPADFHSALKAAILRRRRVSDVAPPQAIPEAEIMLPPALSPENNFAGVGSVEAAPRRSSIKSDGRRSSSMRIESANTSSLSSESTMNSSGMSPRNVASSPSAAKSQSPGARSPSSQRRSSYGPSEAASSAARLAHEMMSLSKDAADSDEDDDDQSTRSSDDVQEGASVSRRRSSLGRKVGREELSSFRSPSAPQERILSIWEGEEDGRYHRGPRSVIYDNSGGRLSTVAETDDEMDRSRGSWLGSPVGDMDISEGCRGSSLGAAGVVRSRRRLTATPQKRPAASSSAAATAFNDEMDAAGGVESFVPPRGRKSKGRSAAAPATSTSSTVASAAVAAAELPGGGDMDVTVEMQDAASVMPRGRKGKRGGTIATVKEAPSAEAALPSFSESMNDERARTRVRKGKSGGLSESESDAASSAAIDPPVSNKGRRAARRVVDLQPVLSAEPPPVSAPPAVSRVAAVLAARSAAILNTAAIEEAEEPPAESTAKRRRKK